MAAASAVNVIYRSRSRIVRVTGTTSYGTGGYTLPAWLQEIISTQTRDPVTPLNDGAAVIAKLGPTGLCQFITAATGAEVTAASDQSGNTVSLLVP